MINNNNRLIDLLPDHEQDKAILKNRAVKLAIFKQEDESSYESSHYIRFKLADNDFYGIPYNFIKEIISNTTVTPVPYVSQYVAGIINRYGTLISVINLKKYFNLPGVNNENDENQNKKTNIIILSDLELTLGILVEDIHDSAIFKNNKLNTALQINSYIPIKYVKGLDQNNVVLLNIESILDDMKNFFIKSK